MIKPSEFTAQTSDLMQELIKQAYDEDEVAVFTGGPDVGGAFSRLPFDHLLFIHLAFLLFIKEFK